MLIFQKPEFLETCAEIFKLSFEGSLFVRKKIIASNVCPLVPYGIVPDKFGLYAQITIVTPPRYTVPERFSDWTREERHTNIIHTRSCELHRGAVRNIQKAEKAGITVEPSEDIGAFYPIFRAMFDLQGIPAPATEEQLSQLFAVIRREKTGELLVARTPDGRTVGGQMLLYDDQQGHAWINATDHDYLKVGTNYLVFHAAIQRVREHGLDEFDARMGSVERFDAFAQNFSPERVSYYRLQKISPLFCNNLVRGVFSRNMLR